MSKSFHFRGNGCDVAMTAATLRHFMSLDAIVGRSIAAHARKHSRSKSAQAAASVWRGFRDLACLCAIEKGNGRNTQVFTRRRRS